MSLKPGSLSSPYANLPLTDPKCMNDSCIAYYGAHNASQAAVSWTWQFEYGHWVTYYYVILIFLALLLHLSRHLRGRRSSNHAAVPNSQKVGPWSRARAAFRAVSYRRLHGRWADYCGLPSAGMLAFLLATTLFLAVLTFAVQPYYRERRGYGSPPLAIRTGLMAIACTPVLFALAGKTNVVTWLTGVGHEKLNVIHRWVAYMCFALSLVHTVPFLVQPVNEGGMAALTAKFYAPGALEYNGTPPFAILFGILLFSLPPIRRLFYELFYYSHHLLAIVYLGLMFWHAGDTGDSWAYLWAALAIYLFQVLARALWSTRALNLRSSPWFAGARTRLHALPGGVTQIRVAPPQGFAWRPGQHAFLRFPGLAPFDSHPFTIASAPPPAHTHAVAVPGAEGPSSKVEEAAAQGRELVFLARTRAGFTRRLAAYVAACGCEARPPAWIDGPYGGLHARVENRFDALVLVAGGAGIAACAPWLEHVSRLAGQCRVKSVSLVWAVRRMSHVEWVGGALERAVGVAKRRGVSVEVRVFVTREEGVEEKIEEGVQGKMEEAKGCVAGKEVASNAQKGGEESVGCCEKKDGEKKAGCCESGSGKQGNGCCGKKVGEKDLEAAREIAVDETDAGMAEQLAAGTASFFEHRPRMAEVVPTLVQLPRTMVFVCGPESLKIDTSNACAAAQSKVLRGEVEEVALHTETFGW